MNSIQDIEDLRYRIGFMYYLYDKGISNQRINPDYIDKISYLFNEILEIMEFANVHYSFEKYIYKLRLLDDEKAKIKDEQGKKDLENKCDIIEEFASYYKKQVQKYLEYDDFNGACLFFEHLRDFYVIAIYDRLEKCMEELNSILNKGDEYEYLKNEITLNEIEKCFRKHLYTGRKLVARGKNNVYTYKSRLLNRRYKYKPPLENAEYLKGLYEALVLWDLKEGLKLEDV